MSNVKIYPLDGVFFLAGLITFLGVLYNESKNWTVGRARSKVTHQNMSLLEPPFLRGHFYLFSPGHGWDFVNEEATACKVKFIFMYMYQ